jgi:hypothetical protein
MLVNTTESMNEATVETDNSNIYENVEETMTFDNLDEEVTPNETGSTDEDDWGAEPEGRKVQEDELGSEELKLLNDSDGKEDKEKKEEKKEEEKEDVQEDDGEDKEELSEEEKITQASENGKKLRIKIGDDHYSLDSSAKLKVKIDGNNEEVTVQELINNYSGKTAWDKKFTEIGNEKKTLQQEKQQLVQEREAFSGRIKPIMDIINDPLKDPFEALELLVDMTGQDSYAFYKRSLEARLDELVNLSQMSDVEQKAFFLEKQNDRLLKSTEKRKAAELEAQKSNQLRAQVDQIRQAYGVSVDQYSEAFEELQTLLPGKQFTHQDVADWASLKPVTPKIEQILEPFRDEINDSDYSGVVTSLSRSLRDGKMTEQQIQKIVKEEFGIPAEVKELNTKLNIGKNKKPAQKEEIPADRFETFDDFDW